MAAVTMLAQTSFAATCGPCSVDKVKTPVPCEQKCKKHEVPNCQQCAAPKCETPCETKAETQAEKDNKCFFDNQFKDMKKALCLSPQQEDSINGIYDRYKNQMQILHDQAKCRQEKLCKMINECADNASIKAQKEELKDIRDEAREQYKCFIKEVKEQLCKDQIKSFNKFNRQERSKMRKLAKYCMSPKFPCDCGCKVQSPCGCN